jgi:hypothetical protein
MKTPRTTSTISEPFSPPQNELSDGVVRVKGMQLASIPCAYAMIGSRGKIPVVLRANWRESTCEWSRGLTRQSGVDQIECGGFYRGDGEERVHVPNHQLRTPVD